MSRPRAIVVTGRLPWPLDDGGRIALWQSVWSAAQRYETTLVSLVPAGEEHRDPRPLPAALGFELVRIPHRFPMFPIAALRGMVGRWPYTLTRYRNRALDTALRRLIRERQPDCVIVNSLHFATYCDAFDGAVTVLRQHNVEHVWLERYAETLRDPFSRGYARDQARRMRHVERALCERFDLVLAIQEDEKRILQALAPAAHVATVPVGVDFARFLDRAPQSPAVVLLAASLGWPPNADGARRFLLEGWREVQARDPQLRLRIVGKDLSPSLAAVAREVGAEPVGYVEDIAPEFARAAALVVPLWAGAGARVKIVEALAARLPVVSTALGAEGLGLTPGREYLAAETPVGLAAAAADLANNLARASALAEAGHAFAREHFSLEAVAQRTNDLIDATVTQVRARAADSRPAPVG